MSAIAVCVSIVGFIFVAIIKIPIYLSCKPNETARVKRIKKRMSILSVNIISLCILALVIKS